MEIAWWCVLVAGLMPVLAAAPAKLTRTYDNADPRGWAARQEGFRRRALAAHANAFEAFPLFAVAVIVADLEGMPQDPVDTLAVVWVLLRVAYTGAYYADWATLRSIVWVLAVGTAVAILTMPAWLF